MIKCIRRYLCCYPIKSIDNKISNIPIITQTTISTQTTVSKQTTNSTQTDTISNNHNNNNVSYLNTINYKDTTAFIPPICFVKVIKVYDGDTITVASKLPFGDSPIYRFSVRLRSIDSPEIRGKSERECDLAIKARDALHNLIFGKIIELRNNGKEKYGRLLADLYYNDIHINKWMVENGYAVKYDGGKKSEF